MSHFGSISPVSIITTCESNWSLIPCRDESSGNPPASSQDPQPQKKTHSPLKGGNNPNENLDEAFQNPKASDSPEVPSPPQCHSYRHPEEEEDEQDPQEGLGSPPMGVKPFRSDAFGFKTNSYTKLPSNEAQFPVAGAGGANVPSPGDNPGETLLEKLPLKRGSSGRRKSDEGNNSHKRKFLHPPKSKLRLTLAKERKASTTLGKTF